jgi:hypothetical protein
VLLDVKIILKGIYQKQDGSCGLDLFVSGEEKVAGFCEQGNEFGFQKC